MTSDRIRLRQTFDSVAELYGRARPGYPPALVDDLVRLAGVGPGRRVLEIGPGTGQLTVPLAERGCEIVAVELGANLAAAARRNLRRFPSITVVTADFERWQLPAERFDLVISATAFHWLDPATRMGRTADALRPGGALATVETHHVAGGTEAFFAEVQDCYLRFDPATTSPGFTCPRSAEIIGDDGEAARSGRYRDPTILRYEWEQAYRTAEYLNVLRTYSSTLDLPPATADGLLRCVGGLIDRRYGGRIVKRYLTRLVLSRRLD
jgi:SAM-dependent methyltransferase